jgi:hypothetical protein
MVVTGLEFAPADVLETLGRCEVCGEQACTLVRDLFVEYRFDSDWRQDTSAGELHRFCFEHMRYPVTHELHEGPLGYAARMAGR